MKITIKNFVQTEPILLKILYIIGIFSFIIYLILYISDNEFNKYLPILSYSTMALFYIRLTYKLYLKKGKKIN